MQQLELSRPDGAPPKILCLGAHADDIEIGAGGAVLTLLDRYPGAHVDWIVLSASADRVQEAQASAQAFLSAAGSRTIEVHDFRDGFFPSEYQRLKECFEALKLKCQPDLIFTHHRADHHQDHRILAELTWNTYRDHLIFGYEIPKYDPDLGNPNVFVRLSAEHADTKVRALMTHFTTQCARRWFVPETFYGLMRLRGVQAAAPSGLAEGFHGPKLCL